MKFKNTIEALQTNAEEINRLLSILKKSDELKRIDVDLILDKLRSMYDLMLDIQSAVGPVIQKGDTETERISVKEDTQVKPKIEPEKPVDIKQVEPTEEKIIFEEEKPKIEFKQESLISEADKSEEEKLKERKQAARTQIEMDLKKEKEEKQETGAKKVVISDRFKPKTTLAEELGSKKKYDDLATQLKTQGAAINTSFGLAEKFEVISELFNGDKEKFEHTLQVASMAGSFVEAYNYLKENFSWDMDNPHVQRLLEQIRRKLIVQRKDE